MVITYYYIGLFHYYVIITYYAINSHYYLLLTVELADGHGIYNDDSFAAGCLNNNRTARASVFSRPYG